jgi:hypothetical protein
MYIESSILIPTVCFKMNVNTEGISPDLLEKLIQVLIMHQYCQSWVVLENYNWIYSSLFFIPASAFYL